jgi:hypothetical protein
MVPGNNLNMSSTQCIATQIQYRRYQTAEVASQGKGQRRRMHKTQRDRGQEKFNKSNAKKPF